MVLELNVRQLINQVTRSIYHNYIPKVMHFRLLSKWQYTINMKYFNFHVQRKWKLKVLCHHLWMGTAITSAFLVIKQGVNTYSLTEKSAGTHSWAAGQVKNAPCLHINKYTKKRFVYVYM